MKNIFLKYTSILSLVLFAGFLNSCSDEGPPHPMSPQKHEHKAQEAYYTCPMHPQVKSDEPGKCPICHMELVRVEPSEDFEVEKRQSQPNALWACKEFPDVTSPAPGECPLDGSPMIKIEVEEKAGKVVGKIKLKESQVSHFHPELFKVQEMKMTKEVRLLGKVVQSEEKESNIPARISGRVEKLHLTQTGQVVDRGDKVVDIYSPELIATGEEYILARKNFQKFKNAEYQELMKQASERLLLWGIKPFQLEQWYQSKKVPSKITLYSPVRGIVQKKYAVKGKYFVEGQSLYDVVDLGNIWVEMDVYEHDSGMVKKGQKVVLSFSAYPGEEWTSEIDFVDPVLNDKSRTLRVRATLDNKGGKLKPGMVGDATLHLKLPEAALVIPRSAIIDTGKRKIVWVDYGENRYVARTIHTGFEAQGYVEIKSGLEAGDLVVVEGNFLLDAQAELYGGYAEDEDVGAKAGGKVHDH